MRVCVCVCLCLFAPLPAVRPPCSQAPPFTFAFLLLLSLSLAHSLFFHTHAPGKGAKRPRPNDTDTESEGEKVTFEHGEAHPLLSIITFARHHATPTPLGPHRGATAGHIRLSQTALSGPTLPAISRPRPTILLRLLPSFRLNQVLESAPILAFFFVRTLLQRHLLLPVIAVRGNEAQRRTSVVPPHRPANRCRSTVPVPRA